MSTTSTPAFVWDYKKYQTKLVDLASLDKLMGIILDSSTSWFKTILACIQILAFFAYLWARKQIIDEAMMLAKQEYEQGRTNSNRNDLNRDNLDATPRP